MLKHIEATYFEARNVMRISIWEMWEVEWHLLDIAEAEGDDHAININLCLIALREKGVDLDACDVYGESPDCVTLADALLDTMKRVN